MARVLFAWELGGDLGHARRVLEVAQGVRGLGHEIAFAFQDVAPLGAYAGRLDWFQAPLLAPPATTSAIPLSASDILLNRGYGDALSVSGALRAWLGIFELWKPDLLVADYAPGASIAGRAASLRQVAIGSGFSTPPPRDPMPAFRSWQAMEESALRRADAALLAGIRGGIEHARAKGGSPKSVSDVFRMDANILCTWPEVDPFGPRDDGEYVGPQDDPASGAQAQWRGEARPRVFAYLKARDPRFAAILDAISRLPGESIVVALGMPAEQAASRSTATMRLHAQPLALAPLLSSADLCVCHGGPGTVVHALAAGVPLALLPQQFEQYLVARRVVTSGAGAMVQPESPPPDLARWLTEVAASRELPRAAKASPVRGRKPASAAARIAAMLGT